MNRLRYGMRIIGKTILIPVVLFVLYLWKCALGIDLLPHYSLGIWRYFQPWVQKLSHW